MCLGLINENRMEAKQGRVKILHSSRAVLGGDIAFVPVLDSNLFEDPDGLRRDVNICTALFPGRCRSGLLVASELPTLPTL